MEFKIHKQICERHKEEVQSSNPIDTDKTEFKPPPFPHPYMRKKERCPLVWYWDYMAKEKGSWYVILDTSLKTSE